MHSLGDLLRASGRLLGVPVIFKDLTRPVPSDPEIGEHHHPACLAVKADPQRKRRCHEFCTQRCAIELAEFPEGRSHTCPFGHTEVAVPVISDGSFVGWLCAGPQWRGRGPPPHPRLRVERSSRWYRDCRQLLASLAARVAALASPDSRGPEDRAMRIHRYLHAHLAEPIAIADLAAHLGLSASRCGHVVRDTTGETFPTLLRRLRCQRAARLLLGTDEPVTRIGATVGITDPSWFAASFRAVHGQTPSAWRTYRRRVGSA